MLIYIYTTIQDLYTLIFITVSSTNRNKSFLSVNTSFCRLAFHSIRNDEVIVCKILNVNFTNPCVI